MRKKIFIKGQTFSHGLFDILNIDKASRIVTHREKNIQKDYENYQQTFRAGCIS